MPHGPGLHRTHVARQHSQIAVACAGIPLNWAVFYTGVRASGQRSFTHTVDQVPINGPTCDSRQRMGR
ncbi:hypothetical protein P171DRAFT_433749 [Karstenula rhodostoma CBS 690.94]|uniref:Uncharacterized protein n=1 Tax=Karstenula rhodostoma CBS 690.94 TaxID=1392251 RepID=A0A9P4PFH8_9PLEO|nr:hypothetical protein P171DRAFT_433749 [Karstenula rhodostoma CBS 690.94]